MTAFEETGKNSKGEQPKQSSATAYLQLGKPLEKLTIINYLLSTINYQFGKPLEKLSAKGQQDMGRQ